MNTNVATRERATTPFLMDNPVFDGDQFANMMAVADIMSQAKLVPEHLQGKPADCFLVVEQARRWNMSPFAVAQETYVVKGKLLFGGKLVTAVVNSRAPIQEPLQFTFKGEGLQCEVTVSGTLRNETEPRTYSITVGEARKVAGTSSLWNTDPKQQACYFGARFWARRHCPEVILGVWLEDEIERGPTMRDITPPATEPSSLREQLKAQAADVVEETHDAETGEVMPPKPRNGNGEANRLYRSCKAALERRDYPAAVRDRVAAFKIATDDKTRARFDELFEWYEAEQEIQAQSEQSELV